VAGASVLVDYVLTVAVSISAGVAAVTSAFPELRQHRVLMCLAFIALLTVGNLRGVKESGRLFAFPTYVYVFVLGALILYGLYRSYFGGLGPLPPDEEALEELTHGGALLTGVAMLALMRAFASGAVALTGIEAIADGVPAFRKPESRNAAITLVTMGTILATAFFGISVLAHRLQPTVSEDETVLSILGTAVFGDGSVLYFALQASTVAILLLAANTAYADFPRVSSIIARDGFLPRQLYNRGDRLVFSNGILALSAVASALIVAFAGITSALIPLYAVGVFTGFTLSQTGMVRYHRRLQEPGWRRRATVNAIGAVATAVVLVEVVVSKFIYGAWIPVVIIPVIVAGLKAVHRHYSGVSDSLRVPDDYRTRFHTHTVVVLVGSVHRGVLDAIAYARLLAPDRLIAVTVVTNAEEERRIAQQWSEYGLDEIELQTLYSPYRELTEPVLRYLDELDRRWQDDIITVVLPEFIVGRWWEQLLHNQSAFLLKVRLLFRRDTVVTSVPYHLHRTAAEEQQAMDVSGDGAGRRLRRAVSRR
jgi:amino acid transporter